jgi:hypothetical protein
MTDDQGSFDFEPMNGTIQQRFERFHRDNPTVYVSLVAYARRAKSRGFSHYGIDTLFEILRWHTTIETTDTEFKLNNNFRSRYARLIMEREPDLADFFELRELKSA